MDEWFGGGKLIVVHSIVASCAGININYCMVLQEAQGYMLRKF